MKSMTGYAFKESINNEGSVSVEIKGYNSRFLDLSIYLPPWLLSMESGIREKLSSRFIRGKIDVNVRIKEYNAEINVTVNENAAKAYEKVVRGLAKTLGLKEKPSLAMILGFEGVLDTDITMDVEKYHSIVESILSDAADQFEAERIREGCHTKEDILTHITLLEDSVKNISVYIPQLESSIKDNLRIRFEELLGDKIDETRILSETAVLLMKYTISEELSRLSSHLSEFRLETEKNSGSGKKLDFLSQEINREINTIGSKTPMLEVSRIVVEMKNALENIREQLHNVE